MAKIPDSDRPLYEDLLEQRRRLEVLVNAMIPWTPSIDQPKWTRALEEIVGEERRRGGLT